MQPITGSSLPIAGTLPNALAPMGKPGSSTTIEVRQQVVITVTSGKSNSPGKIGLRQQVTQLQGALKQVGHREQEKIAYTKYALRGEFENSARQYEAEIRVVCDHEVANAARQASQQSAQRASYLKGNMAELKDQLDTAVYGESAYLSELHNSEIKPT